ncbi:hypothetical protein C1H46_032319 [Malus baccata]|uniref:Uncharacterized protein n=1 Tax=Malus baccata TaxID=106549 RepID=A0A540L6N3_MALBA|nr:hypothetical protein C1H46_032319 [Malus baccata]
MGDQNSKLTPEAEAVPPRILSLLQRRFEEMKSRSKARKLKAASTLSKKQLLKDCAQEEVNNSLLHSPQCSPESDKITFPKIPPTLENKSKVAPISQECDKGTKQVDDEDQKKQQSKRDGTECSVEDHKEPKGVNVYIGGVFAMEDTTEGEEEDEDNEDGTQRNREFFMCPASPSFKIYCMEALEIENDSRKYDSTTDEDIKHKKSPSAASVDCSVDSLASTTDHHDGQVTKTKKKGRRRRRVRNGFGVKNLLHIKGCYYLGCSGGHDRATYLAEKSAAT